MSVQSPCCNIWQGQVLTWQRCPAIPGGDSRAIILGNNFMRSWFTVYTYDAGSRAAHVGFAAAAALATARRWGALAVTPLPHAPMRVWVVF